MSKNNRDFFKVKSEWAKIKDGLLATYLVPYAAKILQTRRPLLYVDCFAGKGCFEDGNDGSPLIALKILFESIAHTRAPHPAIEATFIEALHSTDLERSISDHLERCAALRTSVVSGRYEAKIDCILHQHEGGNVFLYIDPYGIKSLSMKALCDMPKRFPSAEFLLNLNSFGFIREGCRYFGAELRDVEGLDDLLENEEELEGYSHVETWRDIAIGGDYWKQIISDYKNGLIDGYAAEKRLSMEFCQRLGRSYKYVLNFPVRLKEGKRPKYRMIHGCNHPDGCILMYESMSKQRLVMQKMQSHGQMRLFDESVENDIVDLDLVKQDLLARVAPIEEYTPLNDVLASFLVDSGIICPLKDIRDILRLLEKSGAIEVRRCPEKTASGKKTTFMDAHGDHKLYVKGA